MAFTLGFIRIFRQKPYRFSRAKHFFLFFLILRHAIDKRMGTRYNKLENYAGGDRIGTDPYLR